jgi:uncharacterized protein (TIGR02118 family)
MQPDPQGIKLIVLVKRRLDQTLAEFREHSLGEHAALTQQLPGLRRYLQGQVRDGAYAIGEATLDAAYQLWFDDTDALAQALASPEWALVAKDLDTFCEPRYIHQLVVRENWVIGPEAR